ncbi:hypothetical protein D3C85_1028100 [compost metagenome]
MPCPSSMMSRRMNASSASMCTCTPLPWGVNFRALLSRFQTTCSRRMESAISHTSVSGMLLTSMLTPAATAMGLTTWMISSSKRLKSTRSLSSLSLPVVMREMSSKSSMICAWLRTARRIAWVARSAGSELRVSGIRDSSSALSWIRFNGCLSSWDITAKNSSLSWLLAWVCLRRARCFSKRSWSRVVSRAM